MSLQEIDVARLRKAGGSEVPSIRDEHIKLTTESTSSKDRLTQELRGETSRNPPTLFRLIRKERSSLHRARGVKSMVSLFMSLQSK
mmetsp:Transcript_2527/g.4375  ORF Transcript_2527/g.4375 Transcript_2527/m.4375 type:complete len:86 (-) Transcript_2527:539-796(-)